MGDYSQSVRAWLRGLDTLPGDHRAWQSIRGRLGGQDNNGNPHQEPDERELAAGVGAMVAVLRGGADAQLDAARRSVEAAQKAIGAAIHPRTRSAAESLARADVLLVEGTVPTMSQALGAIEAAEDDLESRRGDPGGSMVDDALAATGRARVAIQQAIILRTAVDAAPPPPRNPQPAPSQPQPQPPQPTTPTTPEKPTGPLPGPIQGRPATFDDIPGWGWLLIAFGVGYLLKGE